MMRCRLVLFVVLLTSSPAVYCEPPRTDRFGDPLPTGALTRAGSSRWHHADAIHAVAYSPKGDILASGGDDECVYLWDAATGKQVRCIHDLDHKGDRSGQIRSLAFSQDGKTLAVGRWGKTLLVETATGNLIRALDHERVTSLAFSSDRKYLATGGQGSDAILWDVANGAQVRLLKGFVDSVQSLAFSADGKTLAACEHTGRAKVWAVESGKEIQAFQTHRNGVDALALSPDGKTLATTSNHTICTWNAATGAAIHSFVGEMTTCKAVAFSPDGKLLAGSGEKPWTIQLWEVATGKKARSTAMPVGNSIFTLAFSPDGKTLVAGGAARFVQRWDVGTCKEILHPDVPRAGLASVTFSPDGRTLATANGEDDAVHLWQADSGKPIRHLPSHGIWPCKAAFSPDGRLVAGAWSGAIQLWDSATGKEARRLDHLPGAHGIVFSPDSKILATVDAFQAILWDVASGKEVRRFPEQQSGAALSVAFSPDGKFLIAGSFGDNFVYLWEVSSGKEVRHWKAGLTSVCSLAFSSDGKTIATTDDTVRLWDATSGAEVRPVEKGECRAWTVAISPDGRLLAAGSEIDSERDGILLLWEVQSGKQILWTKGHRGRVRSVAFAPDNRRLVTGADDGTALVWSLPELLGVPPAPAGGLKPAQIEQLWADLAEPDAKRGQRAVWELVGVPSQAVALIRDKLRPVSPMAKERFRRLLADLDSDDFDVREKAEAELARSVEAIEGPLHRALKDPSSAEVRRRIERLLDRLKAQEDGPDGLRQTRALQVLEQIATPEVRFLLKELSKGVPEARQTQEARAVLERLDKKPAAMR